jgi:hypothetical protein
MYLPCPNWAHYWKWADTQYPPFVGNPFFWKMPLTLGAIPYTRFEPHPHNKPLAEPAAPYTGTIDETWRVQGLDQI